jgi:hypothetical protein
MAEQIDYLYDVFISYSRADSEWVGETLLHRLKAAGLRVCIDDDNFEIGVPRLINIERAVDRSRHTLVVLTPAWLSDKWTSFQALLARTQDPDGLERRTIPLILRPCEKLPDFIDLLTSVDFTRPDHREIAWKQLLTGLGKQQDRESPKELTPQQWCLPHPYNVEPNFTGRDAEQATLSQWLKRDGVHALLVLHAPGGFGKSALAWHWLLNSVAQSEWRQVVWWSFYRDSSFENFLSKTLGYLSQKSPDLDSLTADQQVDELLGRLKQNRILLILNGFERALRAYSAVDTANSGRNEPDCNCISPAAKEFLNRIAILPLQSKVLMTTRLLPSILKGTGRDLLKGCLKVELEPMQQSDAVAFFQTQGIRGSQEAIERACADYGYHPMSLRRLTSGIAEDLEQPGHIDAASGVDVIGNLNQLAHHVLEQPYEALIPTQQQLLNSIAQHQEPMPYTELNGIAPNNKDELRGLLAWGLVYRNRDSNYDLHPIVRLYVLRRMAEAQLADPPIQPLIEQELGGSALPEVSTITKGVEQQKDSAPDSQQQHLSELYQQAQIAEKLSDWPYAISCYKEILVIDLDYLDVPQRLERAIRHDRWRRWLKGKHTTVRITAVFAILAIALIGWWFWSSSIDIPPIDKVAIEIDGTPIEDLSKTQPVACESARLIEVKILDSEKSPINPNAFSYTWSLNPPDGINKDITNSKNFTFSYHASCNMRDKTQTVTIQVTKGGIEQHVKTISFLIK